ncbi:MAG TPA: hypothetical protein VFE84_07415 [Patescibacteria group bacterium]|jgi:hypothetical protein|nr:hypothetical protein [Patescibacteria group bacterium]
MRTAMVGLAVVAALAMSPGVAAGAEGKRTLKGTYEWTDAEKSGDLDAVFTPAGEGKWDVAFHFVFQGEPHTYLGTAEGSLKEGTLKGRVLNDRQNRTFVFTGSFTEGEFHGTHSQIGDDGEHPTGTMTLKG